MDSNTAKSENVELGGKQDGLSEVQVAGEGQVEATANAVPEAVIPEAVIASEIISQAETDEHAKDVSKADTDTPNGDDAKRTDSDKSSSDAKAPKKKKTIGRMLLEMTIPLPNDDRPEPNALRWFIPIKYPIFAVLMAGLQILLFSIRTNWHQFPGKPMVIFWPACFVCVTPLMIAHLYKGCGEAFLFVWATVTISIRINLYLLNIESIVFAYFVPIGAFMWLLGQLDNIAFHHYPMSTPLRLGVYWVLVSYYIFNWFAHMGNMFLPLGDAPFLLQPIDFTTMWVVDIVGFALNAAIAVILCSKAYWYRMLKWALFGCVAWTFIAAGRMVNTDRRNKYIRVSGCTLGEAAVYVPGAVLDIGYMLEATPAGAARFIKMLQDCHAESLELNALVPHQMSRVVGTPERAFNGTADSDTAYDFIRQYVSPYLRTIPYDQKYMLTVGFSTLNNDCQQFILDGDGEILSLYGKYHPVWFYFETLYSQYGVPTVPIPREYLYRETYRNARTAGTAKLADLATIICFDINFGFASRAAKKGGHVGLINHATQDWLQARHHYLGAKLKAIEHRVAILKSDISFDSMIIDNTGGAVVTAISDKVVGELIYMHGNVRLGDGGLTFADVIGDLVPWLCMVFTAAALFKVISWYTNAVVLKHKLASQVYENNKVVRHITHKSPTFHFKREDHVVGSGGMVIDDQAASAPVRASPPLHG